MRDFSFTRLFRLVPLALILALPACKRKEPERVEEEGRGWITEAGYRLLLDFEVGGGRSYYERFLAHPTWPGWMSGITIAVGYDLGYSQPQVIEADWKELSASTRQRLVSVQGYRGKEAKERLPLVADLVIDWERAERVFQRVSIPRYRALAERTYPGFNALHRNAQAALLSLTFNRGSSMTGERRAEMREIRACVAKQDYAGMAHWNRASVRVWKGTSIEAGMRRRREAEAQLMERPE